MSETGDERQHGRSDEVELTSRQVQIQSKRFYIDVKENKRGRFIKLAEVFNLIESFSFCFFLNFLLFSFKVGAGGRKSRIIMSFPVAEEFKARLAEFSDIHSNMGTF